MQQHMKKPILNIWEICLEYALIEQCNAIVPQQYIKIETKRYTHGNALKINDSDKKSVN